MPNLYEENLKEALNCQYKENRLNLKKQIEDGSYSKDSELNKKIDNFCKKHHFDRDFNSPSSFNFCPICRTL